MNQHRTLLAGLAVFCLALAILTVGIRSGSTESSLGADYFVFWQAGRFAILQHASPYTAELDRLNQLAVLKRLVPPEEDQLSFAYPPYSLLAIFPTIFMPYEWAQSFWMALLILLLLSGLLIWAPPDRKWLSYVIILFYPFLFGIILGNLVIFFGCLLILVLWGLVLFPKRIPAVELLMGFALAWTTAKPQFSWLLILLMAWVGLRQKRYEFLISFAASCVFFLGISFILIPGWPAGWLETLGKYAAYKQSWPVLGLFFRAILPQGLADPLLIASLAAALFYTGWEFWLYWKGAHNLTWLAIWCGFLTYLIHPRSVSYDQIIFLIPLLLWFRESPDHRRGWNVVFTLLTLAFSWVLFVISKTDYGNPLWPELPVLVQAAWVFYIYRVHKSTAKIDPGHKPNKLEQGAYAFQK
jgi:hypothetical protein